MTFSSFVDCDWLRLSEQLNIGRTHQIHALTEGIKEKSERNDWNKRRKKLATKYKNVQHWKLTHKVSTKSRGAQQFAIMSPSSATPSKWLHSSFASSTQSLFYLWIHSGSETILFVDDSFIYKPIHSAVSVHTLTHKLENVAHSMWFYPVP